MSNEQKSVVITSAVRTAIGTFRGSLKNKQGYELGSIVAKEAIKKSNLNSNDIDELINKAKLTLRNRVRFCSHHSTDEIVHEMFIVHPRGAYVRPHKHLNKSESLIIIEGEADYVVFDNEGNAKENIPMGDYKSGKSCMPDLLKNFLTSLI